MEEHKYGPDLIQAIFDAPYMMSFLSLIGYWRPWISVLVEISQPLYDNTDGDEQLAVFPSTSETATPFTDLKEAFV